MMERCKKMKMDAKGKYGIQKNPELNFRIEKKKVLINLFSKG
jgi:hypothetical protein